MSNSKCALHTEHAWRGDVVVGRYFPADGPSAGLWEVCTGETMRFAEEWAAERAGRLEAST